jgi:hypothetical protein
MDARTHVRLHVHRLDPLKGSLIPNSCAALSTKQLATYLD